jgi:hypothetical protein
MRMASSAAPFPVRQQEMRPLARRPGKGRGRWHLAIAAFEISLLRRLPILPCAAMPI